ncbi:hypothetical protein NDU88_007482 [Pleurodeles waltl]|uniref:Uncharacterized protein n=1 Tax=Pleurodeles waltl TaxID=8319 RepID=A0AAV7NTR2_PLEWA|nr:hypothetical protein NDU88_007482 [Pleurodeles waltl]
MTDKDQPTTMERILQEITAASCRIEGVDASISSLTLETKSMRSYIVSFKSQVTGLEHCMGTLETQMATIQDRDQDLLYLRSKITDLEDRSRRDNICLFGIPENEEGLDAQAFLSSVLTKLTSLTFDPPRGTPHSALGKGQIPFTPETGSHTPLRQWTATGTMRDYMRQRRESQSAAIVNSTDR